MRIEGLFFVLLSLFSFTFLNRINQSRQQQASYHWAIDPVKSRVGFQVKSWGLYDVSGEFLNYEAKIASKTADLTDATIHMTIYTESITTNNKKRDRHLKSDDFFDVERYPEITFTSDSFKETGPGEYLLSGQLTMLGQTNPVVLKAVQTAEASPYQMFHLTGTLDRYDYDLEFKKGISDGIVDDEVKLTIDIYLIQER